MSRGAGGWCFRFRTHEAFPSSDSIAKASVATWACPPCTSQVTGVAVHMRRGDVTPRSGHRWIPEKVYLEALQKFESRPMHVHSQGSPDEFKFCQPPDCILKLNIDVLDAFRDAVCARHFVGSGQSLLSVSIALMRRQNSTLVFRHRGLLRSPPPRWQLVQYDA